MILRGLAVAASGFLFIFSPGLPLGLLARRSPSFRRDLIYWGIGLWIVMLPPSLFLQSLLRQALVGQAPRPDLGDRPLDYALALLGALPAAILVQGAMALVLRRQKSPAEALQPNGLALGFGVGLIAQLFTGLGLVGAGFGLMFGDLTSPIVAPLAQASAADLLLGLIPLVLFRPALLVVSAVQGVLVGQSLDARKGRFFLLAVLVGVLFAWAILAAQLALGVENPGQVTVGEMDPLAAGTAIAYYLLAFILAYRWLEARLANWRQPSFPRKRT